MTPAVSLRLLLNHDNYVALDKSLNSWVRIFRNAHSQFERNYEGIRK